MYPIITGAASLATDGVELAVYDISSNKLMEYTDPNIISLKYSDNVSQNPKNSRYLALIYGGGREMGNSKKLVLLDISTGKLRSL